MQQSQRPPLIAIPSGILCKVIEKISIKLLFKLLEFSFFVVSLSNILSPTNKSNPPSRTPKDTTNQEINFREFAISIAGDKRLQNVAASITPADKASIASIVFYLPFLKKNTTADPSEVIAQVNIVAISACHG